MPVLAKRKVQLEYMVTKIPVDIKLIYKIWTIKVKKELAYLHVILQIDSFVSPFT
jgi:hypothetical protein